MAELFLGGKVDPATHDRTGDDVHVAADDLTTHGVIVGMTGSGKTGLGVVLVEEVLRAGRPALLIDPKGDLTNLCLTFPALQAADFRPWIDDRQAAAEGVSPPEVDGVLPPDGVPPSVPVPAPPSSFFAAVVPAADEPPRKSVTYQPEPLSWKPAAVTCLAKADAPQDGQTVRTGSEIFWRTS